MKFYRKVLDMGKTKKKCIGCDRAIHPNEKHSFEAYVSALRRTALTTDHHSYPALLQRRRL